ncbi:hypothetical protein NCU08513 [Neurospora crassa OR74A]|uniref:Uncharacterized protein n=2 Tax=Neurospora crassa TaxID=5141 RepID=Q7SBX9_NEUCR|nr:hypothetical protein NCU08513 [Neurospora crassa OR74A]EAA33927.1 hypothetical protein NCU08513 [Neurospora crassa OR74A]CAE75686.1 hypothetical protein [Neurospora crassa]|eukprot:XP_963163.1 hypothetical protein NCU08513 [Neurospora crassa OR74A]
MKEGEKKKTAMGIHIVLMQKVSCRCSWKGSMEKRPGCQDLTIGSSPKLDSQAAVQSKALSELLMLARLSDMAEERNPEPLCCTSGHWHEPPRPLALTIVIDEAEIGVIRLTK